MAATRSRRWFSASLLCLLAGALRAAPPLQLYVALTPAGGTLKPEPGTYSGPVVVDKPITIDGGGKVTIDGGGEGTVLTILADGVTVRGLHLTRSGTSHDAVDAGILVKADGVTVENNVIDETLFGIHLSNANDNVIRNNRIRSLPDRDISIRGDGIRVWYSHGNLIQGNRLQGVRDLVFSNASENRVVDNRISDSRISMEFVYSPDNEVSGNTLEHNVTGITVIYSESIAITGNRIAHMRKLTGSGISVKESYDISIDHNEIAHCAVGLLATSPLQPENILHIENNLFTYNDVATYFYGEKGGHVIHANRFVDNFVDVMGSAPPTTRLNHWQGNFWDRYAGFDRNGDGVGDQPYRVWLYADRIWMERSMARFFRGTVGLSLVDFMERLVPSSEPDLIYEDPVPLMQPTP
ncbi:MAG TPA: nitrous oxide reductase family maturation protein NosD [Thiolapillus brandeum]|uniref:Nitrous oxide reductase family maturation protein NosD n=1 Tax=Thiolapillus brandeum TaxID=1076588 RepID=A0A7C5N789_9GAMM|nr:nitrous oxide reductase family maturation protein NosD [Thiolapillus brandeum]